MQENDGTELRRRSSFLVDGVPPPRRCSGVPRVAQPPCHEGATRFFPTLTGACARPFDCMRAAVGSCADVHTPAFSLCPDSPRVNGNRMRWNTGHGPVSRQDGYPRSISRPVAPPAGSADRGPAGVNEHNAGWSAGARICRNGEMDSPARQFAFLGWKPSPSRRNEMRYRSLRIVLIVALLRCPGADGT